MGASPGPSATVFPTGAPLDAPSAPHAPKCLRFCASTTRHEAEDTDVGMTSFPYYRTDLARVHHCGFGFHADSSVRAILALLDPIHKRDGLVVELGCGSGVLTRHLVEAGHRVIATDASPAILDVARLHAPT